MLLQIHQRPITKILSLQALIQISSINSLTLARKDNKKQEARSNSTNTNLSISKKENPKFQKATRTKKMKREGWQHGMVRSTTKATTTTTSTIGLAFAKAPSKPTGNSKYTGKCKKARCTQCHSHPVSKSRDKAKGTYKLKSSDVVLNHRLVSWRVVGDRNVHWSKYSGVSASGVLDALLTDSCWSQGDDEDHEEQEYGYGDGFGDINQEEDDEGIEEQGYGDGFGDINQEEDDEGIEEQGHGDGFGDINQEEDDEGIEEQGYGDDDYMGFCEVGFVLDCMDEEGWCVVDEM